MRASKHPTRATARPVIRAVGVVALLLAAIMLATACAREASVEARYDRATEIAAYTVGAIAEGSFHDVSALFGREVSIEEMRQLQEVVPPTYDADPRRYGTEPVTNEDGSQEITTVRVFNREQPTARTFLVRLRWNPQRERDIWNEGEYVETVRGDWEVLAVVLDHDAR